MFLVIKSIDFFDFFVKGKSMNNQCCFREFMRNINI